jgi:hypothetical protein
MFSNKTRSNNRDESQLETLANIDESTQKEVEEVIIAYVQDENLCFFNDKNKSIKKIVKKKKLMEERRQNSQINKEQPITILKKLLSLLSNENNLSSKKEINVLENILISKIRYLKGLEEDIYNMLKESINSDDIEIEKKKYLVNLLNVINTDEAKTLLIEIYNNLENMELKKEILELEKPIGYTLSALEAKENNDLDNYESMIKKLKDTDGNEVVSGFMTFAKNDDFNSLDNIRKLATEWSNNNLSQQNINLTEDYLSRADTKPNERIMAISILANMEDKEQRDAILRERLENENNQDVMDYIQTIIYNENI